MGFFKKVFAGVKDAAKAVSYVVAAPFNSATSHKYNPKYETEFGKKFGAVLENSVDNVHAVAKGYADSLLFGLPTKLANKFRSAENQESVGHYLENSKSYGIKALDKLNRFSGVLGSTVATGVLANFASKQSSTQPDTKVNAVDSRGVVKLIGVFVVIVVVLRLIFGRRK